MWGDAALRHWPMIAKTLGHGGGSQKTHCLPPSFALPSFLSCLFVATLHEKFAFRA
jgi:hypothetical protein